MNDRRKSVVIVGASADRSKYSNKSIRAHLRQGWQVYPVNPRGGTIEGLTVYTSVKDIPGPIDRISLYLPPAVGVTAMADIAAAKPTEFFVNPGAESEELVEKAQALGLDPILACSIIDVGASPGQFPDD
ncbi:MAG: CoA-binding protein [Phycisphaerae bacterium]|nr:CoA-binding protein [Phycisphaerae bacterium]